MLSISINLSRLFNSMYFLMLALIMHPSKEELQQETSLVWGRGDCALRMILETFVHKN